MRYGVVRVIYRRTTCDCTLDWAGQQNSISRKSVGPLDSPSDSRDFQWIPFKRSRKVQARKSLSKRTGPRLFDLHGNKLRRRTTPIQRLMRKWFVHLQDLITGDVLEYLPKTAWPANFNRLC